MSSRSWLGVVVVSVVLSAFPRSQCVWESVGQVARPLSKLAVFDDGSGSSLYRVGGDGTGTNPVSHWDGRGSWESLGTPPVIASFSDGIGFDDGSGPAFYTNFFWNVARHRNGVWSNAASPIVFGCCVSSFGIYHDGVSRRLVCGGTFTQVSGVPASGVAIWDGSGWTPLGGVGGPTVARCCDQVRALISFDDGTGSALYAGGNFRSRFQNIARWDGATWSATGTGLDFGVRDFAIFDDGSGPALYAAGEFTGNVARWSGSSWQIVGGGMGPSGFSSVRALEVFDDGTGPALIAAGYFSIAGGASAQGLAKWNGQQWSEIGGGVGPFGSTQAPGTLAVFDDGTGPALYVGGGFDTVGGQAIPTLARLRCTGARIYGSSTPGCAGDLLVGSRSVPELGDRSFAVTCRNAPPGRIGIVMLSGSGRAQPITLLDVDVWVEPFDPEFHLLTVKSDGAGDALLRLPVPADPSLTGDQLFTQFEFLDSCARSGVAASDALAITVR